MSFMKAANHHASWLWRASRLAFAAFALNLSFQSAILLCATAPALAACLALTASATLLLAAGLGATFWRQSAESDDLENFTLRLKVRSLPGAADRPNGAAETPR
jgi:hypothetical protein